MIIQESPKVEPKVKPEETKPAEPVSPKPSSPSPSSPKPSPTTLPIRRIQPKPDHIPDPRDTPNLPNIPPGTCPIGK
ncbi:MAG: hypothetical protein KDD56_01845 [Bdellovibrionales bacterium]|nr:hypothetical protein [Bdellovibrionales bacterium]